MLKNPSFPTLSLIIVAPCIAVFVIYKIFEYVTIEMSKTQTLQVFCLCIGCFLFGWVCSFILRHNPTPTPQPKLHWQKVITPTNTREIWNNGELESLTSKTESTSPDNMQQLITGTTINFNYIERFFQLSTPSRAEWTGKTTVYQECAQYAISLGALEQTTRGYMWKWGQGRRANYISQIKGQLG